MDIADEVNEMFNQTNTVAQHSMGYILKEVTMAVVNNATNVTGSADPQSVGDTSLEMTRFIVQRIFVPIVTSIGFFGNLVCICVLTQRSMVSSTNCYLTTLSVFDLLYLLFSFTLSLKHYPGVKEQNAYTYWFPYGRVFTDICSNVSVVLTVTFSLERLIAVCYPMKGRIICTPERARIITFFVTMATIGCTAPEFFEFETKEVVKNGTVVVRNSYTALADTTSYKVGYQTFIGITFTILPLVLLITCNGLLIRSVLMATRLRRTMTTYVSVQQESQRRQSDQNRITVMLIAVVVVFLLCQTPNAILLLYASYTDMQGLELTEEQTRTLIICANVVNLLIQINASMNFILYSVMSTKFRRVFCRVFCRFSRQYKQTVSRNGTEMSYFQTVSMGTQNMTMRFRDRRPNHVYSHGFQGRDTKRLMKQLDSKHSPDYPCEKEAFMYRQSTSCSSGSNTSDVEAAYRQRLDDTQQTGPRSCERLVRKSPVNGLTLRETVDRRN